MAGGKILTMHYDEIAHLQGLHPAWKLLRSDNVALVLSFLGRVFVDTNAGGRPASELAGDLDEELYALNQRRAGHSGQQPHLTDAERALYQDLIEDRFGRAVRLEQERMRFSLLRQALQPWTGSELAR
jgi:hypothetical protein